jgi:Cohesin domain
MKDKNMSKWLILPLLLPLVVALFVPCVVSAGPATAVTVEPISSKVGIGDTFSVDIFVEPDTDIAGAQFNLSFNASVVMANTVTEGNLFSQGGASTFFMSGTINNVAGTITNVAGATAIPGASVSQSGTFATVTFTAGTGVGTSALHFGKVVVGNLQGQAVAITVSDGSVTVCPDWDVNLDLRVNVLDMILPGQQWGQSGAAHWIREDVNRDGAIDVLDMILIGQHWTG